MTHFLAVDLGTSFIKGAVLDLESRSMHHIRRVPFPAPIEGLAPLRFEVDPAQIVTAFRRLISELLAAAPDSAGLVMGSQMHGLVLTDDQGQPHSTAITWQDQHALEPHPTESGSYFEQLSAQLTAEEKRHLGKELKPSLPLCYLYCMAQDGKLPVEPLIPASLPDFVLANLSGTRPTIELTHAAAHGAINLETLDWDWPMLTRLGLAHLQWPSIRPFHEVAAVIEIGSKQLPCYGPVGDHQTSLVGAFLDYGDLSVNVATASQVTILTPELQLGDYQTRPFFDGRFINTISRIPAGRALNALIDLLTEIPKAQGLHLADPWTYIAEAVAGIEETDLQVDLSFFVSSVGDEGSIRGIREDNLAVGHLFRAAFDYMADKYALCAGRLSPQGDWQGLVFSGGLVRKLTVLQQIIQQKFGVDYRLCAAEEDALLGLMALALVADGRAESVSAAIGQLHDFSD